MDINPLVFFKDRGGVANFGDDLLSSVMAMLPGGSGHFCATGIQTSIEIKNGKAKITRTGLVEEKLDADSLPSKRAAESIKKLIWTADLIAEKEDLLSALQTEARRIEAFISYEPDDIKNAIWEAFPQFVGDAVEILEKPVRETKSENKEFELFVNSKSVSKATVGTDFGKKIVGRNLALANAHQELINIEDRIEKTQKLIAGKKCIIEGLQQKVFYLLENECPEIWENFIGIDGGEKGPVIIYGRFIDEELTELSQENKKMFVAEHLKGNALSKEAQEALGIKGMIDAVEAVLGNGAKVQ